MARPATWRWTLRGVGRRPPSAEIRFRAQTTADNGLGYGAYLELDMDAGGSADEINLFFFGDWGRLELGDQDGAEDAMPYDGTFSLTAQGGYDATERQERLPPSNASPPPGGQDAFLRAARLRAARSPNG